MAVGYDEVIKYLGEFGRYQKQIYFLLCLPAISCAFHKLAGVFLLAIPQFRCVLPIEENFNIHNNNNYNTTEFTIAYDSLPQHLWKLSYPYDVKNEKWQTCMYYNINYTDIYSMNDTTVSDVAPILKHCEQFVYDKTIYHSSAVSEWNMVCNRSLLSAISDSLFMVGVLLGSIIFGQISDRYGRKPTFFAALVLQEIFGILAGLAPEYVTYTVSRMIVGATTSGVFLVAYVTAMEMVGASYRLFVGVACQMFFSVGFMLTAAFAYFIRDWRWLQIALTLPGMLFMCYYWIIPESARWLLSKGRKIEAIAIIEKAAEVNNVVIPQNVYDNIMEDGSYQLQESDSQITATKSATVFDLLRSPNLRKRTLLIFFDWFVNSGTYYGLSWNTNNLGGNVLLNFVISGAVEIPAYTFLLFTLNKCGRRTILCGCMLTAGISLLLTIFVPKDMNWLIILLAMFGKLAITSSYGTIYIFSAEQFPTVVRNVGLGASSMIARFGGILAPYLNSVGQVWRPLPLIICGSLAFSGGLLSLILPETLNKTLPETMEDGEIFGRSHQNDCTDNQGIEESTNMLDKEKN